MSLPPELRVLCRKLASSNPEDLPRLCPTLVAYVLRCAWPLSAPLEARAKDRAKAKEGSSEASTLVHKLRTQIHSLLHGRVPSGRFAAIVLVKALVDVGGWECLRASGPWVQALLAVLKKPDTPATKELCIITLVRIYTLLHGYQTLVRDIVSPTLPDFVTACLQLIKPGPSRQLKVPLSLVNTIAAALSSVTPLYPTTVRPFAHQIRTAFRAYLAPTSSDSATIPRALCQETRRLVILLHHTAPKNGSSAEWESGLRQSIKYCHATANELFRAVEESWESTTGYHVPNSSHDAEPSGGDDTPEGLPPWTGLEAGAERMLGLLELLRTHFLEATKSPVAIPLGEILDLTTRLTLVSPPTVTPSGQENSVRTHAAISREEKDELWTLLPELHLGVMRLHLTLVQRLRRNMIPLAADVLDQLTRIYKHSGAPKRDVAYDLLTRLLQLIGPSLPKITVESIVPLLQDCCHVLLADSGHLTESKGNTARRTHTNGNPQAKANDVPGADAFLAPPTEQPIASTSGLSQPHRAAASRLLAALLTHLPQRHLTPDSRGLLDRTAVLVHDREAMFASCLHPYRSSNGRYNPTVLPFLVRRFPDDQGVEILRANLRSVASTGGGGYQQNPGDEEGLNGLLSEWQPAGGTDAAAASGAASLGAAAGCSSGEEQDTTASSRDGMAANTDSMDVDSAPTETSAPQGGFNFVGRPVVPLIEESMQSVGEASQTPLHADAPVSLKRKAEAPEQPGSPKRIDKGKAVDATVAPVPVARSALSMNNDADADADSDSDSESSVSVQIDMTMDDDDDDDDEDEDGDSDEA